MNRRWIQDAAPLAAVFLWVWLGVDPSLRFQHGCPALILDSDSWRPFIARPGGIVEGLAALTAQLDRFPIVAAALFTTLTGLIVASVRAGCGATSAARPLSWLPGLSPLLLYSQYSAPAIEHAGGILVAVGALAGWRRAASAATGVRLAMFWLLSVAVFYSAGTVPCLLLVVAGGTVEATSRQHWPKVALCWLAALIVPLGLVCFPAADAAAVWRRWGNGLPWVLAWTAYGVTAVTIAAGGWLSRIGLRTALPPTSAGPPCHAPAPSTLEPAIRWLALFISAAAAVALIATFDWPQRTRLRIQRAGENGRWREVLEAAPKLRNPAVADRLQVERALYHTGRLCGDLFTFPHRRGDELLPSLEAGPEAYPALSDTLLELGHVNLAERYAHEALESNGERPEFLRRLARINVLKDRPVAARVFLGRLAKMPFERAWAEAQLQALTSDTSLASDPVVAAVRPLRVTGQLTEARFTTEMLLAESLKADRSNRMAFEYLIAHLLLNLQVEAVLQHLPHFKAVGFTELPRHVSEAVLLHQKLHPESPVNLTGWTIPETIPARFEQYLEAASGRGGDDAALARDFGDTFWYYAQRGSRTQ